jgi:hypothetical protein
MLGEEFMATDEMGTVNDPDPLKQRARRFYEIGRLRGALGRSIPALAVAAVVSVLVHQASIPLALGVALYAASVALLWWGRVPGRGVLPGLVFGLVPLAAAVIAYFYGQDCVGAGCYRVCTVVCFGGGLVAGLLVARIAVRSPTPIALFVSAASVAFLTGIIGGACMGLYPVIGMAVAIAIGFLPVALRSRARAH